MRSIITVSGIFLLVVCHRLCSPEAEADFGTHDVYQRSIYVKKELRKQYQDKKGIMLRFSRILIKTQKNQRGVMECEFLVGVPLYKARRARPLYSISFIYKVELLRKMYEQFCSLTEGYPERVSQASAGQEVLPLKGIMASHLYLYSYMHMFQVFLEPGSENFLEFQICHSAYTNASQGIPKCFIWVEICST